MAESQLGMTMGLARHGGLQSISFFQTVPDLLFYGIHPNKPLVTGSTKKHMENHPSIKWVNQLNFDWAIFNNKLLV